jgi:hypothetical protein
MIGQIGSMGLLSPRAKVNELGHQLAVIFEGDAALSTTLDSTSPLRYAHSAAAVLIDTSVSR